MIKVAVDAMGGDHAPSAVVEGAVRAAREFDGQFGVILTGPVDLIQAELDSLDYVGDSIEIVNAPEIVGMDESPASILKTKPNSGLVKCVTLQKQGVAQASVSAGNSGAMMATCLMTLGRIPGVSRPAIAVLAPSATKRYIMLDCGANVDEKPQTLFDFAICGKVFAEQVLHRENPTIGLLNIGEEAKKGTEVLQETYKLLKESELNFIGNIEGRGIIQGEADVIVTSGAVGNVALKMMEGFYALHKELFGDIDTPEGHRFSTEWNYENHGGAMLLGLNGTGIISHGSSNSEAIKVAIKTAADFAEAKVSENIAATLTKDNA